MQFHQKAEPQAVQTYETGSFCHRCCQPRQPWLVSGCEVERPMSVGLEPAQFRRQAILMCRVWLEFKDAQGKSRIAKDHIDHNVDDRKAAKLHRRRSS